MAARQNFYDEDLAQQADSGATYTTRSSVTFTPDANADYMLIFSALMRNTSNLTADCKVRLQDTTNTVTYHESNIESKDLADWYPVHGVAIYEAGASDPSTTFAVQIAAETAADVCHILQCRIFAMKLGTDDIFIQAAGNNDTTSGTYVTSDTLTFTPPSTGDYLFVAACDHTNSSGAGDEMGIRVLKTDGTTGFGEQLRRTQKDATNFWSFGASWVETGLTATSKSVSIQHRNFDNLGDTSRVRNRTIVGIRLDAFVNYEYNEVNGRTTSTSTTPQNGASITVTPNAGDHLILATGVVDSSSTTISVSMQFDNNTSIETDCFIEAVEASNYHSWYHMSKDTLAASSGTWRVQAHSETTSVTTGRSGMSVLLLELEEAGGAAPTSRVFIPETRGHIHTALLQM